MGDPSGKKEDFPEAIEALSKKQIDYAIYQFSTKQAKRLL